MAAVITLVRILHEGFGIYGQAVTGFKPVHFAEYDSNIYHLRVFHVRLRAICGLKFGMLASEHAKKYK